MLGGIVYGIIGVLLNSVAQYNGTVRYERMWG